MRTIPSQNDFTEAFNSYLKKMDVSYVKICVETTNGGYLDKIYESAEAMYVDLVSFVDSENESVMELGYGLFTYILSGGEPLDSDALSCENGGVEQLAYDPFDRNLN